MTKKNNYTKSNKTAIDSLQSGEENSPRYCSMPQVPERVFTTNLNPDRLELIVGIQQKWVNGTTLKYYFFDKETDGETVFFNNGTSKFVKWTTNQAEKNVVKNAFKVWKDIGIGLNFVEVSTRDEAQIRIGFMRDDGAWSFLGRDILNKGRNERTMNFGWDITNDRDTAIHEIGHTLGFPHEHQNPFAGIVWDEEAVYSALASPPNRWDRAKTFHNIIRKIQPDTVQGSSWDPNSIMHYPFGPGMILQPAQFNQTGINPAGGLSERDKTWAKQFYPPIDDSNLAELHTLESVRFSINAGQQVDFVINPTVNRYYEIQTFGTSDTVMVLFEDDNGNQRYMTADDDSGEDRNAYIKVKLVAGKKYVLRVRLYYSLQVGETGLMMW
jgi:hypothetical protein